MWILAISLFVLLLWNFWEVGKLLCWVISAHFNLTRVRINAKIDSELTFHWGALRACGGNHYHHPHAGPSAVGKVLRTVLFTHHLHKGSTPDALRWLHVSVWLRLPFLGWSAAKEMDGSVSHSNNMGLHSEPKRGITTEREKIYRLPAVSLLYNAAVTCTATIKALQVTPHLSHQAWTEILKQKLPGQIML